MKLKDKAISIKGNAYVLVGDRVIHFNENYPNGSISTELVSDATADMVVVKATVLPDCDDPQRMFTGYSQATWGDGMVNKTAALENCETSAVGRALGFMGIGVIDSVASADEMNKAMTQPPRKTVDKRVEKYNTGKPDGAQKQLLEKPCKKCGGEMVLNPRTGIVFCKAKCWTK